MFIVYSFCWCARFRFRWMSTLLLPLLINVTRLGRTERTWTADEIDLDGGLGLANDGRQWTIWTDGRT